MGKDLTINIHYPSLSQQFLLGYISDSIYLFKKKAESWILNCAIDRKGNPPPQNICGRISSWWAMSPIKSTESLKDNLKGAPDFLEVKIGLWVIPQAQTTFYTSDDHWL